MGVRILHDQRAEQACLYCSTSDFAFGPVFNDRIVMVGGMKECKTAEERAQAFLRWLHVDPRKFKDYELESRYVQWLGQEEGQYTAEAAKEAA